MERETKTITTTGGHNVVLYSYATGREAREIESHFLSSVQLDMGGMEGKPSITKFNPSAAHEAEKAAIRLLVRSVDGKAENVLDDVLNLKQDDFEEIVAAINEITAKKKK